MDAARAMPADAGRPAVGWEPVKVPDIWVQRWPGYDGTVWYRIHWERGCPGLAGAEAGSGAGAAHDTQPIGLSVSGVSMAGEVYINDDLLWRDASLVEPLSQSWNMPRYWLLPESA